MPSRHGSCCNPKRKPEYFRWHRMSHGGRMLYALHELHKTITAPLVAWADASNRLFTNPYSPLAYHPLSRTIAASHEVLARLMRSYEKPAWDIDHVMVRGEPVAVRI